MAVTLVTLSRLEHLEQEMAQAGRIEEETALREALSVLARSRRDFMTTGQAAEQLGISIPTVKRWIGRGTLDGGTVGGRWLVSRASVERIRHIRETLAALDEEGYPTDEEIQELYRRGRPARAKSA